MCKIRVALFKQYSQKQECLIRTRARQECEQLPCYSMHVNVASEVDLHSPYSFLGKINSNGKLSLTNTARERPDRFPCILSLALDVIVSRCETSQNIANIASKARFSFQKTLIELFIHSRILSRWLS